MYQSLWVATKVVLREELMVLNAYIRVEEKSKINDLGSTVRR